MVFKFTNDDVNISVFISTSKLVVNRDSVKDFHYYIQAQLEKERRKELAKERKEEKAESELIKLVQVSLWHFNYSYRVYKIFIL